MPSTPADIIAEQKEGLRIIGEAIRNGGIKTPESIGMVGGNGDGWAAVLVVPVDIPNLDIETQLELALKEKGSIARPLVNAEVSFESSVLDYATGNPKSDPSTSRYVIRFVNIEDAEKLMDLVRQERMGEYNSNRPAAVASR